MLSIEDKPALEQRITKQNDPSVLESLCAQIRADHGLSAKQFFQKFLVSKEPSIIVRRKQCISPSGWKSTKDLLNSFKDLVIDENTSVARHDWEEWILEQVKLNIISLLTNF